MIEHNVYLGLGANLGDKEQTILHAISLIGERVGRVRYQSSIYTTDPWGFVSDNKFANAAVCCITTLTPRQVLEQTQEIERMLGRTTKTTGTDYHDRAIDIDILMYDDLHVDEPDLKIPHPLMREREFVMVPLNEIFSQAGMPVIQSDIR